MNYIELLPGALLIYILLFELCAQINTGRCPCTLLHLSPKSTSLPHTHKLLLVPITRKLEAPVLSCRNMSQSHAAQPLATAKCHSCQQSCPTT